MRPNPLLLVVLLLLTNVFGAGAQVTAGFTASPTSGCPPLLVNFTNTTAPSTGTTYSWTFGTSGSSVLTDPSTSFTTAGVHIVTLVATNGTSVGTYTMAITVYPLPTVNFVASDTSVCAGTPITFTSTTVPGVAGPMTYSWGFGDGSPVSTSASPVHTYASPGYYTVTLYATNSTGCTASLTKTMYIHVYDRPTVGFTWTPTGGCNPPVNIVFTSTSSGPGPLMTTWTFGDGGTGSGSPISHTYTAIGSYPVKLVVVDANGCTDSATLGPIVVNTISASYDAPESACVYSSINFTNTSSPHSTRTWNYGDGSPVTTGVNGYHVYSSPGTYVVTLTISNPPCTSTITHTITILPGPTADFTANPTLPCPAPATVTYTATAPPGTIFTWLFPGSGPVSGNPATFTYTTNGVKTVNLIIEDPVTGCKDTVTKTDTIYDLQLIAHASAYEGCAPLTVTFGANAYTHVPMGTSPYPAPISSYTWSFGDGSSPGAGATPTHTFVSPGVYVVTVTATTANGCTVTDTLTIKVGNPPIITVTGTPGHVCYGAHVGILFNITIVSGPVDEYHWTWGDGGTVVYDTSGLPVTHTYTVPGTFTVTVVPYYHGCPGPPFTLPGSIIVDSAKAIISDTVLCSPPTAVVFHNLSLGDDTHVWLFGDGGTSTLDDVTHTYPGSGTYTVTLAVLDTTTGCRDTAKVVVNISAPTISFVANDTTVCKGQMVSFTSSVSGGTVSNYYWAIDGTTITGATGPVFNYTFTTSGYHSVRLVVRTPNGCYDTVTRTNYVFVSGVSTTFTGTPLSGCSPLAVTFTDGSTPAMGTSIITRVWTFGDGFTGSGSPVVHTYTAAGTYSVKEVVTDNNGCKDSLTRPNYITVYHPIASFTATNQHPCIGVPDTFTCTTASATSCVWTFGDGSPTGTGLSCVHAYSATGTYSVKMVVTDTHGCVDSVTYPAYIRVTKPNASFTQSDSISVCPPVTVDFTNTSTGAISYAWDLGDGSTSTVLNPEEMYLAPGLFTVLLVATDSFGCKDTTDGFVNVFGYAGAFTYTPLTGCAPLAVHFTATLSNVPFITWDFSDGTTASTSYSDTFTHIYVTPGAYVPKLLLTDNTGCQNSSVGLDTIKVDALYAGFTTWPSPICVNVPFNFVDTSFTYWSPVTSWIWTYDGHVNTTPSPTYTITAPGLYPVTLSVTNAWGCTDTIIKSVEVLPPPIVTAVGDTTICIGDSATLSASGAVTYTWDPAPTIGCTNCNPTKASPPVETTYTVTGTDSRGCKDTAVTTVLLRTKTTASARGDTAVCPGVPVQLIDSGATTYLWLQPGGLDNNTIYNPIATLYQTTTYMVIGKLGGCIPDTDYVTVTVYPSPTVDAGPDQYLLSGSQAQLEATGTNIVSYLWSPDSSLNCPTCYNPVASMSVTTTYTVEVTSLHGCKASDTVRVKLYCDNSQVFIPNAFTPNGDGENDLFYPRGVGIQSIKTFRIYNRWGELLFEKLNIPMNDATNAWNGYYRDGTPRPDVYVYVIEAVCYAGDIIFIKGDVTIIR